MSGFSQRSTRKRIKSPSHPPQGKDLRRPEAKKALQDTSQHPPKRNAMVVDNTTTERKPAPPPPTVKPKPIPGPTQGETTEQAQRAEATDPIEQPPTDSAPQGPTRHTQPKPKKGRRAKGEKERCYNSNNNGSSNQQNGGRQVTLERREPGPGDGQSKSSHVRDDKDTRLNTPLNQDWPGSDAGYSGRPDTRGDVLNLRIIYWNPGGIIGKTRELRDLAQLEDAHIILLGETKLRPEQELKIPNFFAYRRDEISARGPAYRGTAVLVRRDIMHEAEQLTDFETMRSIGVSVGSSEQEIRLFAAYRPPGTKMCVQDIHAIIQEQTPTLIIGDLNAKQKAWESHSISRAGRLLMEDAERQG
ncbi:Probable RNA-directed DNA polymerase from transposon BS [Eumeta japonica]|uniref:Probable RNA-directed DNA polymerase from transposon BS n=1 Tax=Eumeta variegata TaxID=151549 RepID=A0A4C1VKH2_EUMVA|nr:Probable RNA-directed DNA polymerase from transposon BS [Eumeta japonica]